MGQDGTESGRQAGGIVPERIYFDMDGVLADFDRGVAELAGFEKRFAQGESRAEDRLMWRAVRRVEHYYDRLEPIPGSLELFRSLRERYGGRCEILTGIPAPRHDMPESADDKASWVRRLLGEDVVVHAVYRREKVGFCEGAGSILIDDFPRNIAEWRAAGGTAVLFAGADAARRELLRLGIL